MTFNFDGWLCRVHTECNLPIFWHTLVFVNLAMIWDRWLFLRTTIVMVCDLPSRRVTQGFHGHSQSQCGVWCGIWWCRWCQHPLVVDIGLESGINGKGQMFGWSAFAMVVPSCSVVSMHTSRGTTIHTTICNCLALLLGG